MGREKYFYGIADVNYWYSEPVNRGLVI